MFRWVTGLTGDVGGGGEGVGGGWVRPEAPLLSRSASATVCLFLVDVPGCGACGARRGRVIGGGCTSVVLKSLCSHRILHLELVDAEANAAENASERVGVSLPRGVLGVG